VDTDKWLRLAALNGLAFVTNDGDQFQLPANLRLDNQVSVRLASIEACMSGVASAAEMFSRAWPLHDEKPRRIRKHRRVPPTCLPRAQGFLPVAPRSTQVH
jgi:hypothetical protein